MNSESVPGKNRIQTIVDFLGLKRNMLVLLTMVVLVGLGEKMAERFLPLYLVALGGGAFSVGLLNGMDNLLSALYSYPGGYASDRLGYKRALVLFNLIAMLGYTIVIIFPSWQAVIIGAISSCRGQPSRCRRRWHSCRVYYRSQSGPWASRCTRWYDACPWRWVRSWVGS